MRIVVVPSTLALLPRYAGIEDPIPELRAAVISAVEWLTEDGPVSGIAASPSGQQVVDHLLGSAPAAVPGILVAANGSAMRSEKAPGHFDERAEAFDAAIGKALAAGDFAALGQVDIELAAELWAGDDAATLAALGRRLARGADVERVQVDYDDAPYGVQYWVVRYECASS